MTDPFEILRASARAAVIPTSADVRHRGHRRLVRVRVAGAVGAVLVVTAGTGVAVAVQGNGSSPAVPGVAPSTARVLTPPPVVTRPVPATTQPPGPTEPAATPTPSLAPPPTIAPPLPTATSMSPTTPAAPPAVLPKTPPGPPGRVVITRPPPAPTLTAGAVRTGLYLSLNLRRTSAAGDPTVAFDVTVDGTVGQMYGYNDPSRGPAITQQGAPSDVRVRLDGKDVGGADGGEQDCPTGDTRVHHEHYTWHEEAIVPQGTHTVTFAVDYCGISAEKSFTVTVP